jgi:small subunit ribosomal protein S13
MARVAGVDLPRNKRMEYALTYINGIGRTKAREILKAAGISFDKRSDTLDDNETRHIREIIEQMGLKIEGDLQREISMNIKRLMDWAATAACAIGAVCRFTASGPRPTPGPARDRARAR